MRRTRGTCQFCHGVTYRKAKSKGTVFHCLLPGVIPTEECWIENYCEAGRLCLESMLSRKQLSEDEKALREKMVKGLLPVLLNGDKLEDYLRQYNRDELMYLLHFSSDELRQIIQTLISGITKIPEDGSYVPVQVPKDLPDGLVLYLEQFYERVKERHFRLVKNGHSRHAMYVRRRMNDPLRLAVYLADQGIERWDLMTNTHVAHFIEQSQGTDLRKLKPFINFISKRKKFTDGRGRGHRSRGWIGSDSKLPDVLSLAALKELIKSEKDKLTEVEYLAFWLVAKMGLRATHAYDFTLDRMMIDEKGHLIIRTAKVWVKLPSKIAEAFELQAKQVAPKWPYISTKSSKPIHLFHQHLDERRFLSEIMRNRANLIRNSAIFAAMQRGHLDRVTIHETMGVSMPTIVKLEKLLSTDMHRVMNRHLAKKRNEHILGKDNG